MEISVKITEQALLKGLVHVIWADGEVTEDERELLGNVLVQLGSSEAQVREVAEMMVAPPDLGDLKAAVPDHGSRLELMKVLLVMAHADGNIDVTELHFLEKMARELGISPEEMESMIAETDEAMADES